MLLRSLEFARHLARPALHLSIPPLAAFTSGPTSQTGSSSPSSQGPLLASPLPPKGPVASPSLPRLPPFYRGRGSSELQCIRVNSLAGMALEKVEISRNGDGQVVFDAYVTGAEGAPGVVVIQEWWGVDFEIKEHADTLAGMGFRALIPDLYRGKVALDEAEAQHLLEGLDWPGAVKDIEASVKWLKEHGSTKVGVTGFCMGGALAVASAVLVDGVSAAAPFYGTPPAALADAAKAKAPVQGHFGEMDKFKGFSDIEAAKGLEEKLKESGVPYEVHLYPGQGHAFMNATVEGVKRKVAGGNAPHDQTAVDLAWKRTKEWFDKYLK